MQSCPSGVNLGILRNKGSRLHQRGSGDDTIGGTTAKIVAQLSSLTAISGVKGRSSTLGKAKACSNQSSTSRSRVIRPLTTAVATSRQLIAEIPI